MRGWRRLAATSLRTDGYSLVDKAFNDVEIESLQDPQESTPWGEGKVARGKGG